VDLFLQPWVIGPLVGIVAGLLAGYPVHRAQQKRAGTLPYLPAHAEAIDGEHDATTRFYAAIHEMVMAVVEAWNAVHARTGERGDVETTIKRDLLLPACEAVLEHGAALTEQLDGYRTVRDQLHAAGVKVAGIWSHRSQDHHMTQLVTESYWDAGSEGFKTREVLETAYSHTDHVFTCQQESIPGAVKALTGVFARVDAAHLPVPDPARVRVALDRIDDVERMFLQRLADDTIASEGETISEARLTGLVNQWLLAPSLPEDLRRALGGLRTLRATHGDHVAVLRQSERTVEVLRGQRHVPGPPGFRAARVLAGELERLGRSIDAVFAGIRKATATAETLRAWVRDGDTIETDREYIEAAIAAYEQAFPKSVIGLDRLPDDKAVWAVVGGVGAIVGLAAAMLASGLS